MAELSVAMTPSDEERRTIVDRTSGQRNNCLWLQYKKIRLTASSFGRVLKAISGIKFTEPMFKSFTICTVAHHPQIRVPTLTK